MDGPYDELWVSLWERVGREWKMQNWLRVIRESFLKAVCASVRQKGEQGEGGWRRKDWVSGESCG